VLICRRETLRFETLAAWYPNLPKVLDALSSSGSPSTLTCTLTLLPPHLNEGGKERQPPTTESACRVAVR